MSALGHRGLGLGSEFDLVFQFQRSLRFIFFTPSEAWAQRWLVWAR